LYASGFLQKVGQRFKTEKSGFLRVAFFCFTDKCLQGEKSFNFN